MQAWRPRASWSNWPRLVCPGREPDSRPGAVTTVTLAIQVAVSVRQLLERVPRPAHQGRWRGPACAAQLLSAHKDALDMPRHVREEDARGFALALGKMVLTSGVGEVVNIARLNVRTIAV